MPDDQEMHEVEEKDTSIPELAFVSNKIIRVDLANGEWVDVKEGIPFAEFLEAYDGIKTQKTKDGQDVVDPEQKGKAINAMIKVLQKSIVAWSVALECTPEQIALLKGDVIIFLTERITSIMEVDKKKSQ